MAITGLMAAPLSDRRLQVWASKPDGSLQTLWKTSTDPDSAWTPWQRQPASSLGVTVGCAAPLPNGALHVFVLANAGFNPPYQSGPGVQTAFKLGPDSTAGWSDWQGFYSGEQAVGGGSGAFDIGAGLLTDGRIQVFIVVLGNNGPKFYTRWKQTTDVSSAWTDLSGFMAAPQIITRIAVARLSDGRMQLFATCGNAVLTTWKADTNPNAAWTPWQSFYPMNENDNDRITAASLTDGRPQLWRLNRNGALWSRWKENTNPNSGWTEWSVFPAPGNKLTEFAAAPLSDGRLQLFAADDTGAMFSCWKASKDPNAAWTPWSPFARP